MSTTRNAAVWILSALVAVSAMSCVSGGVTDSTPTSLAYLNVALKASSLRVGEKTVGSVIFKNASGISLSPRAVSWASATPAVAKVSADGEITAVGMGTALIVATSDGKSGAASLIVDAADPNAAPVASITIAFDLYGFHAGDATVVSAVARDADGNIVTGHPVTWETSDPTVATV